MGCLWSRRYADTSVQLQHHGQSQGVRGAQWLHQVSEPILHLRYTIGGDLYTSWTLEHLADCFLGRFLQLQTLLWFQQMAMIFFDSQLQPCSLVASSSLISHHCLERICIYVVSGMTDYDTVSSTSWLHNYADEEKNAIRSVDTHQCAWPLLFTQVRWRIVIALDCHG